MKYKLNDKIEIQKSKLIIDDAGFQTVEYQTIITFWANHKTLSYKHINQANSLITKKVESFLIRKQKCFNGDSVTENMFVLWKNKKYKIISIDDTFEDSNYIMIRCETYE